jgi:hypothetical protein
MTRMRTRRQSLPLPPYRCTDTAWVIEGAFHVKFYAPHGTPAAAPTAVSISVAQTLALLDGPFAELVIAHLGRA